MNHHWLRMSSPLRPIAFTAMTALALVLAGGGCGTVGGSGSDSFASVVIANQPTEKIAATTAQVFAAEGYRGGTIGPGEMVFEKAESGLTTVSRDGIAAAQSGARTINRVRVEIVPLGDGSHRLQCKAYMVTGGSDPFFQDEVPLAKIRSGPYQSLLNKIEKQLQ